MGKAVLDSLVKQIEESYKKRVEQTRSEIDDVVKTKEKFIKDIKDRITLTEKKNKKDIMIKKNRIKSSTAKIKALKENIVRIEHTMVYVKKVLPQAELNAEKLASKIEVSLLEPQDSTEHANIILQVVNYPIMLRNQIDSLAWKKEKLLAEILSEENSIKELEAEIELLKIKYNSIKEREIVKLKSEIESLKSNREHVTAILMRQNPMISPLPIKSKIKLKVLLAGVVGLFFFVFLAFFIEYIKNASKSSPANKRT